MLNEIQFCCRELVKNPRSLWIFVFFYNLFPYTIKGYFNIKRRDKILLITLSDNNRKLLVPNGEDGLGAFFNFMMP